MITSAEAALVTLGSSRESGRFTNTIGRLKNMLLADCSAGLREIGKACAPVGWQGATQPVVVQQQDLKHDELRIRAAPTGWQGLGEAVGVEDQQLQERQGSWLSPGRWQ